MIFRSPPLGNATPSYTYSLTLGLVSESYNFSNYITAFRNIISRKTTLLALRLHISVILLILVIARTVKFQDFLKHLP